MNKNDNPIIDKSIQFALKIIEYSELLESHKKYVIAKQLIKAGTSIGANIHEAQSAESKKDFIHKLKIADKEARETEYWLTLCRYSKNYPAPASLQSTLLEIKKLLSAIISSTVKLM
ncbi:four helix bundle protein [Labilibacter sediminis]|nr:four helix bundle protein [Labilibacter sediminis]